MKNLLFLFLLFASVCVNAQGVAVSPNNSLPDSSAGLDVNFTNKGLLPPRLTTAQMNAIHSPARGLMVYNTDCDVLEYWNGNTWVAVGGTGPATAPTAGTNTPSPAQIIWNWNTVSGATGYKYNTVNDYSSAVDNGTSTTYTQTALTCNTGYTLYVWAYNTCGNSASPTILTQTTSGCCVDGTGGAISHYYDGNNTQWTVHTFTNHGGTFTPGCAGNVRILVIAGGGGGGVGGGGGGGAGGFIYNASYAITQTPYAVTVGAGGAGAPGTGTCASGSNGQNSVFDAITAVGGGAGGEGGGNAGGSGGGGSQGGGTGGAGTNGQGNAGGSDANYAAPYCGAGGGGAGSTGFDKTALNVSAAGAGGDGLASSITGTSVIYAGGGGGGCWQGGTGGAGGSGGGGAGCANGQSSCVASSAIDNTGGGGGGCGCYACSGTAGTGGSGIVIISYPTP